MRFLPPDDAADVVQASGDDRDNLLALLDEPTRKEVSALLAYAEDEAGGLMSPRYARVRPTVTVDEAISYLRKQARERVETLYYAATSSSPISDSSAWCRSATSSPRRRRRPSPT